MRKEKDFKNLQKAIENYTPILFRLSPSHMGNKNLVIYEKLNKKKFNFLFKNDLRFFIDDKELICLPLEKYFGGFKLEYQDKRYNRLYPYYNSPNHVPKKDVFSSCFRHILDDLLIEISFKGKIKLEPDENFNGIEYWKLK